LKIQIRSRLKRFFDSYFNNFFEIILRNINSIDLRDLGNFSNYCDVVVKKNSIKRNHNNCKGGFKLINCIFQAFGRKSPNSSKRISRNFLEIYKNFLDDIIRTVTNLVNEFSNFNFLFTKLNFETLLNEILSITLSHLYGERNLEKFLKEEVDKFNDYFNIQKIVEKQNFQINSEFSYIKEQEENKFLATCISCKTNLRNVILFPCMHFMFCNVCSKEILLCGECPICNLKVDKHEIVS
jgi:hypothetical protein